MPAALTILLAALTLTTPSTDVRIELSDDGVAMRIEVSDHAPPMIELAGDAIVPVTWTRDGRSRTTAPLLLMPGTGRTIDVTFGGVATTLMAGDAAARIRIDPATYVATPRSTGDRRWPGVALTAALTLLLASRAKRPTAAIALATVAWTLGLATYSATRPDVARVAIGDVTWLIARRSGVARVEAWRVPIVESTSHLRSLAPRFVVDADGRATLALTLPRGARVALAPEASRRR